METGVTRRLPLGWLAVLGVAGLLPCRFSRVTAQESAASVRDLTDQEIGELVRDLGNPSYEARTAATRRLTAVGIRARKRLEEAAAGSDFETQLRAKQLLDTLDRLLLAGVEVTLSLSESKVAWDKPVDLLVTLTNRSEFPARTPFETLTVVESGTGQADRDKDAEQVAKVLDIADWLKVRKADGLDIDLRVDDIAENNDVVAVVQARLSHAPTTMLEPGRQVTVRVPAINRGWARYPMLDAGTYQIFYDYNPEWDDAALNTLRIGRVLSSPVPLTITRSAPQEVSRSGVISVLALSRAGDSVVVTLTNASDRTLVINRSFGIGPPFAQGRWTYQLEDAGHDVPFPPKPANSWDEFADSSLVQLDPGRSLELARADLADLRKKLSDAGVALNDERGTLQFSYHNQCDRQWQARQGGALLGNENAPALLRSPLPRRILTTSQQSNELPAVELR